MPEPEGGDQKDNSAEAEKSADRDAQEPAEEKAEEPAKQDAKEQSDEQSDKNALGEVTPSFKEAMDSYEAFFDEYIAFMKKYEDTTDYSAEMLEDLSTYMERYTETMEKLEAIDEESLSPADYAYYSEVMLRINDKLAQV